MDLNIIHVFLFLFGANNFHHGSGHLVEPGPVTKTSSEAGHCRLTLEGGPGSLEGAIWIGWDNLVNEPMGPVFDITYDECRMTPDDKFLLPDGMSAISIKKIHLDRSASYYEDFQSYVQDNTQSINLDVSAGGMGAFGEVSISGSYSHTHQEIKKNFQSEQSTMLHTKLNYHAYDLPNQLGERLHPEFMAQLLDINNAIQGNLTRKAQYLSQMLIRNYGTHVITQAKIGAIISQEDYMKQDQSSQSIMDSNLDEIKMSASYSFFSMFSFGMSFSDTTSSTSTNSSKYASVKRYSKVRTTGGPDVNSLLSASFRPTDDSQAVALVNDVVPIDRAGIPLFAIINDQYFPNYVAVDKMRSHILNATAEYYKRNTVYGCTDSTATNFNFQANVDDNNCITPPTSYTGFGGIFQRCWPVASSDGYLAPDTVCDKYRQQNDLTGADSCPALFDEEILFDDVVILDCERETVNTKHCHGCGFLDLETCCDTIPVTKTVCNTVHLQTSWCRPQQNANVTNVGFLFGGLFLDGHVNPYTKTAGCAGSTAFTKTQLGLDLNLCLSMDSSDEGQSHTLSTMLSCLSAVRRCPTGTSMHFATKINDCDIFYCSPTPPPQFKSYTSRPLFRPPYLPASALINDTQSSVQIYFNDTLLIQKLLQEVIDDMYALMLESVEHGVTNTDLIPFSMSDLVAQWANGLIGHYFNQNETTVEPPTFE